MSSEKEEFSERVVFGQKVSSKGLSRKSNPGGRQSGPGWRKTDHPHWQGSEFSLLFWI